VSAPVALVATADALALAGLPGGDPFDWAWCGEPAAAAAHVRAAELVVTLGPVAVSGESDEGWVRWLAGRVPDRVASVPADVAEGPSQRLPQRVIAQAGAGLWRRAPWPVADALFELAPPSASGRVVVLGRDAESRAGVARLEAYGIEATAAEWLTLAALETAAAVLELATPGDPAPAWLMAPLAARRVLLRVGAAPDFGLQAGVDHFAARSFDEAATLASALAADPRAFDLVRAFGALTAERHRASKVLSGLLTDVRLERAALEPGAGRPAAPRWRPPV